MSYDKNENCLSCTYYDEESTSCYFFVRSSTPKWAKDVYSRDLGNSIYWGCGVYEKDVERVPHICGICKQVLDAHDNTGAS